MAMIYDGFWRDPRIVSLSDRALVDWLRIVGYCNQREHDTHRIDDIVSSGVLRQSLAELEASSLVQKEGRSRIRALGRLDLWAYDSEVEDS